MARIILEDMKLNKNRKQTILKKDDIPLSVLVKEEINNKKNIQQKQELKKEEPRNEYIKEPKIEEYFKKKDAEKDPKITSEIINNNKKFYRFISIIFIASLFIGVIYWGGYFFQKGNITITSKQQQIIYNKNQFVAGKDDDNAINFEIMITSDKKPINIILTESKDVSIKSEGSITLYNEFSTKPEKLSAGTFILDNNGKTYKTNSTVSIQGYKLDTNKKIIPGQIVVNISSFLAGDMYNGSPSDFHINSFKGTTKYNKIYGKLKTPLTGGASGLVYILDDLNNKNINNIANTSLKEELIGQVKALVPPGYILYPDAMVFSYTIGDKMSSTTPETKVEVDGVLSVVLLKEKSLIDNIIKTSLPDIQDSESKEIKISDLNKLSFSFANNDQLVTKDITSIPFSLTGNINAIWNPDIVLLKTKLLGVYKSDVMSIFKQDPGVSSAIVNIFPPWQKYIPNDSSKININLK